MNDWQLINFTSAFEINPKIILEKGEEYCFVNMKALNSGSRSVKASEKRIFKGGGSKFEHGDTLMARITPCLENGKICRYIGEQDIPAHGSTEFIIIRGRKGVSTDLFAYYITRSSQFREYAIGQMTGTSGRQRVPTDSLSNYELNLPPFHEQHAIAHILGTLDDKIELNRQMNENLEAIAQAIFKSWFVGFDPVRTKMEGRKPYGMDKETATLFPDEFEDSELGEIPNGWRVTKIKSESLNIQYGYTQSASKEKIGPQFLRITDIRGGKINWNSVPFCKISEKDFQKYQIKPGDIFVARTGASTGENIYIIDAPKSVFASFLVRFQFTDIEKARFIGKFMRSEQYFDFISNIIGGSAQPNASAQILSDISLVLPPKDILDIFYRTINPMDQLKVRNEKESLYISKIRDTLLPKLISGEIRIRDAEKFLKERGLGDKPA